jgi:2'-5' RNA ligase
VRTFIAIELDEGIRTRLAQATESLRGAGCKVRWVTPDRMHLTLKFLGEIDPEALAAVAAAMATAAAGAGAFQIQVAGLGAFPPRGAPRVVWAGVGDAEGKLAALHGRLDEALAAAGFERDSRAFRPHLTLGRVKERRGAERLRARLEESAEGEFGTQEVRELVCFRSELSAHGPAYTPLGRQPL